MHPQTVGRYTILEKIGAGGMGIVYKARDPRLRRDVAIKILPSEAAADGERRARFEQEAQTASALNHPNIATVYEIAADDDGTTFIAMEYVPGRTLAETIPRKGLNLAEALHYAVQIADALARAHSSGIIHRDVKPGNIIITPEGRVKLLDFGLAKLVERDAGAAVEVTRTGDLTADGMVLGTTRYMSPEQARGKPVDARTDIFSFGAVLYEMIAGRHAFTGDSVLAITTAVVRDDPIPLSESAPHVPRDLERIVTRCLRKDPDRRFQSAADLKVALQELREESESGRRPTPVAGARRRRTAIAGVALLALVLALVWMLGRDAPVPAGAEMRLLPLTTDPGEETMPSLSPDGTQVVYAQMQPGRQSSDLYVLAIESGARLRLTDGSGRAGFPQWSPDGKWILFGRQDRGLFLISPLGGPERRVLEWGQFSDFSWLPDGRRVLFASAGSPPVLQLLNVQTGEVQRVAEVPHFQRFAFGAALAVSQDAELIATGERDPVSEDTRVVIRRAADGSEQAAIPYSAGGGGFMGMAFLPARQGLLVSTGASPVDVRIYYASLDGRRQFRVADTGHPASFPALSLKGDRIAFSRRTDDENIYRLPLSPSGEAGGEPAAFAHSTTRDGNPDISFDGQRVVFGSYRNGAPEIYVADASGNNPVRLTSSGAIVAGSPRFSPDGKWIAFDSRPHGEPSDIFAMSTEGGPPRNLSNHPAIETAPTWSRDGRFIYFHSNRSGSSQVWKMRADGSDPRQITRGGGYRAVESVDGKAIFYAKTDDFDATSLWTAGANGGNERMLVPTLHRQNIAPVASGVYISTNRGLQGGPEILFYRFADRTTRTVYRPSRPVSLGLSIAPDESWLLFTQLDGSGTDLMLLENFSPVR